MKNLTEIYASINEKVIQKIEQMECSEKWECPFIIYRAQNPVTKNVYSGINAFFLSLYMGFKKWEEPYFLTFNQVRKLNGKVKKGERAVYIATEPVRVYYLNGEKISKKKFEALAEEVKKQVEVKVFCKTFPVFNIAQTTVPVDVIKLNNEDYRQEKITDTEQIEQAIRSTGAIVRFSKLKYPSYSPSKDIITMPNREQFKSDNEYYSTLLHELAHWTGAKHRLNRFEKKENTYAFEELVAELTTAYLCTFFNVENERTLNNNIAYLAGWKSAIEDDKFCLQKANKLAQEAFEYLQGLFFKDNKYAA